MKKTTGVSLVMALLVACSGIKMQLEQSPEFIRMQSSWRTYAWQEPPLEAVGASGGAVVLIDSAVRKHVEQRLAELGYRKDPLAPSFKADYRIGGESAVGLPGILSPRDAQERILAGPNAEYEVTSRFYAHRTLGYHETSHLKLTFFDVAQRRLVWAATASRLVENPQMDAAKTDAAIGRAVEKLLRSFPVVTR